MIDKQGFLNAYNDLFSRGEMIKAQILINSCVPLPLENDKDIQQVRKECNDRIEEILKWNNEGRPYPGTHATIKDPLSFPKFNLALKKIALEGKDKKILDVGCYSGDFLKMLADLGHTCTGVDIHEELMEILNRDTDGNPNFIHGRADRLSDVVYYDHFDIVMLFDVIEHCFFPESVISEVDKVAKEGALIMINLPKTSVGYTDDAYEHLHMFSDDNIREIWGSRKEFKLETSEDESGNPTSFITYRK